MNHWIEASKRNLLPLSVSHDFKEALAEWSFTGDIRDSEDDEDLECELCEHPDLKAQYEIKNRNTLGSLWVGSSCILKFADIEILDKNNQLIADDWEREQELKRRYQEFCNELAAKPIRELWQRQPTIRAWLKPIGISVKRGGALSPADMVLLLKQFEKHGIACRPKLYKVSMQSFTDKNAIKRLLGEDFELIRKVLSKAQIASAIKNRNGIK